MPRDLTPAAALLILTAGLAAPAEAGSPIRSAASLKRKQERIEKNLVRDHLRLVKKLQRADRPFEAWLELKQVLRIDPENRKALAEIPQYPPPPPVESLKDYAAARGRIDKEATRELGELIERGEKGKLSSEDLTPVAMRLLEYELDHEGARRVLGFTGAPQDWVSAAEAKRQAAFKAAFEKAPTGEEVPGAFPKLAAALGVKLTVRKTPHAFVAGVNASADKLDSVAKSVETAWAAIHHDLFGGTELFGDGDGRAATGVKLKPLAPPLFLVLDDKAQHLRFLDKVVTDKNLKVRGRSLGFLATNWAPERVLICESRTPGMHLVEWSSMLMTHIVINQRFGRNRPVFLKQSLARYYSGLVSGRAYVKMVASGTQSDGPGGATRGDYNQLRWLARWAYARFRALAPSSEGLRRPLDAIRRTDLAVGTAWVDYLLSRHRAKLIALLKLADSKKIGTSEAFAKAVAPDPMAFDSGFVDWLVKNL